MLELVDDDGRGVGQFVTGQAKQLFAHHFAGHEALAAVGELFGVVHPRLLWQVRRTNAKQTLNVPGVLGRHRHKLGKRVALLHGTQPGRQIAAAVHQVKLVRQQHHRDVARQQVEHLGIGQVEVAGLHHKQNQVHIGHGAQHRFVQSPVQGVAVAGLKAWGVHKHKLVGAHRAVSGDAVARGLRLARRDADLLPHQRVQKRGLAHVGLAHNGHIATVLRRRINHFHLGHFVRLGVRFHVRWRSDVCLAQRPRQHGIQFGIGHRSSGRRSGVRGSRFSGHGFVCARRGEKMEKRGVDVGAPTVRLLGGAD